MAEPKTFWRNGESRTVTTPSQARSLIEDGWTVGEYVEPVTGSTVLGEDFPGFAKLREVGIMTVADLLANKSDLSRVPGIGERTLDKIISYSATMFGLDLRG